MKLALNQHEIDAGLNEFDGIGDHYKPSGEKQWACLIL
jgi:hypothetical protein